MIKHLQTLGLTTILLFSIQTSVSAADSTDPTRDLTRTQRTEVTFDVWLAAPMTAKIIKKESHGNCKDVGAGGKYRGKWQMTAGFWKSYGGLDFAPRADLATCEQQDQVAYKGWQARGWQPWGRR